MKNQVLEKLIEKYLSGTSTEDERRKLEKWYTSVENDEGFVEKLSDAEKEELEDNIFQRIDQNIFASKKAQINQKKVHVFTNLFQTSNNKKTNFYSHKYKIAAVLMASIISIAMLFQLMGEKKIIHSTPFGKLAHITLPDSSTVILNGNSTLTYGNRWLGEGSREVFLEGEAFFSVKHTGSNQKFIVHTSEEFNIEVLGTEFNVSNRKSGTRVVLNSGKVQLNINDPKGNEQVTMKPGDLVEFIERPANYKIREVNAEKFSSWKDKKIILDHTSLREILTMLRENYGLNITVIDKDLLDQKISGSIPSENIKTLLEDIAIIYKIKIVKNKNTLEIQNIRNQ